MSENFPEPTSLSQSNKNRFRLTIATVLITVLTVAGCIAYQLIWTNFLAHQRANSARTALLNDWTKNERDLNLFGTNGKAFALLYIPRLREETWATPVLQGVGTDELNSGVGHYPLSAAPGEVGNFALAGHRATHGEPFAYFDQLRSNDQVIVRTNKLWFTYTLDRDRKIKPTETWVVNYPLKPPLNALITSEKLISLVTCDPRWGSARRWVWWGHLTQITRSRPAAITLDSAP